MTVSLQPQTLASSDPMHAYEACVRQGKLMDDEAQRVVIGHLQTLYKALGHGGQPRGFMEKLFRRDAVKAQSIYIWGQVGRGKSLLMDMLHHSYNGAGARRIHFQAFMQEVHTEMHAHRIAAVKTKGDLLAAVAADMAKKSPVLLCLDELEVRDVADAMILGKLITALLETGVTFVITSNRPPEELYLGGLQREQFMEFIALVYARMEVLELASALDYRMLQLKAMQNVYLWPEDAKAALLQETFTRLTHDVRPMPVALDVQGRTLMVEKSYGGIAFFTFAALCVAPLGSADYIAIARRFHTVFISGIPRLIPEMRNEARRFVTLIDILYDHRVKLICTAAAAPDGLYTEGDGILEFRRTVSRLSEMQSETYLASSHIP